MKTLLLDRDGVINEDSDAFIRSPDDWRPLAGSLEAIVRAQHAGHRIIVISNQSGLARRLLGIAELNAIHARMQSELARLGGRVDAFFFCPHGPRDGCDCRKPEPGMLTALAARLGISLAGVPFVGDRATDAEAARRAGALPILVRTGHKPLPPAEADTATFDDLAAAVDALIATAAPA